MDYFKVPYSAYVILIVCVLIISFLKLLLSNKLILRSLQRKNYGGKFSIVKASLTSFVTEILTILIPLALFTLAVESVVYHDFDIDTFWRYFSEITVGFVLISGDHAGAFGYIIITAAVVFDIMFSTLVNNFTFLRKIDIPESKRNGIAFLTALINAPWHLFIPYSLFIRMIFFNDGAAYV